MAQSAGATEYAECISADGPSRLEPLNTPSVSHIREGKKVHTFPNGISSKVNDWSSNSLTTMSHSGNLTATPHYELESKRHYMEWKHTLQ